jgi:hypothetical protein
MSVASRCYGGVSPATSSTTETDAMEQLERVFSGSAAARGRLPFSGARRFVPRAGGALFLRSGTGLLTCPAVVPEGISGRGLRVRHEVPGRQQNH